MKGGFLIEKFRRRRRDDGHNMVDISVHSAFDKYSINPSKFVRMGANLIYSSKLR